MSTDDHDNDLFDTDTNAGDDDPQWLTAWRYPTHATPELTRRIRERVLRGASPRAAAMAEGVLPNRLYLWLSWGRDAYQREADGNDMHSGFLTLLLQLTQASGMAMTAAEMRAFATNAVFWLSHHPEARGAWGGDSESALLDMSDQMVDADPAALPAAPPMDDGRVREVWQMLEDMGYFTRTSDTPADDSESTRDVS